MRRRTRRAARRAGGRREEKTPARFTEYLAAQLYGNNPRITVAVDNDRVAILKVEPAPNTKVYYSQRGEKKLLSGAWGAALVVDDPDGLLEFSEDGRLRLRVMSADELEAFAWKLIRFANYLRLATALGASPEELRDAYWGGGAGGRRRTRGPEDEEPEEEEEYEATEEGGFEEVELA